jgi:adenylate kinase
MLQILLLSGSPGTGKTAAAKYLEQQYGWKRISLTEFVVDHHLYESEDPDRDTKIIDEEAVQEAVRDYCNSLDGNVVIEGHYADLFEFPEIKLAIIIRCHPNVLQKRLNNRKYSKKKIKENIQAEIVADCTSYMMEKENLMNNNRIFEIDSSTTSIEELGKIIVEIWQQPEKFSKYAAGTISWMSDPSVDINYFID